MLDDKVMEIRRRYATVHQPYELEPHAGRIGLRESWYQIQHTSMPDYIHFISTSESCCVD